MCGPWLGCALYWLDPVVRCLRYLCQLCDRGQVTDPPSRAAVSSPAVQDQCLSRLKEWGGYIKPQHAAWHLIGAPLISPSPSSLQMAPKVPKIQGNLSSSLISSSIFLHLFKLNLVGPDSGTGHNAQQGRTETAVTHFLGTLHKGSLNDTLIPAAAHDQVFKTRLNLWGKRQDPSLPDPLLTPLAWPAFF